MSQYTIVLDRFKILDFLCPFNHQSKSNRLNTACRQIIHRLHGTEFIRKHRRHQIAHIPIQYPSALLGLNQLPVNGPLLFEGRLDRRLRYFLISHSADFGCLLTPQNIGHMGSNRLAFTIRVRGENYFLGVACRRF